MKKVILSAALAAVAAGANAQQIRWGGEVGVHLGNLVQELPELNRTPTGPLRKEHVDGRPNLGLRAGIVADIGVSDNFSIQPGLLFAMKGVRYERSLDTGNNSSYGYEVELQEKLNINYIELPINLQYKTREDGTGFFVGVGPYFAYAFGGKNAADSTVRIQLPDNVGADRQYEAERDEALSFGDNADDDIKNLDVGVGLNVGYMLPQGAFVRAFGQYGFSNIYPVAESEFERKNYGFGLTVGYMFGGKRGTNGQDDPNNATD